MEVIFLLLLSILPLVLGDDVDTTPITESLMELKNQRRLKRAWKIKLAETEAKLNIYRWRWAIEKVRNEWLESQLMGKLKVRFNRPITEQPIRPFAKSQRLKLPAKASWPPLPTVQKMTATEVVPQPIISIWPPPMPNPQNGQVETAASTLPTKPMWPPAKEQTASPKAVPKAISKTWPPPKRNSENCGQVEMEALPLPKKPMWPPANQKIASPKAVPQSIMKIWLPPTLNTLNHGQVEMETLPLPKKPMWPPAKEKPASPNVAPEPIIKIWPPPMPNQQNQGQAVGTIAPPTALLKQITWPPVTKAVEQSTGAQPKKLAAATWPPRATTTKDRQCQTTHRRERQTQT